jgi:hypothetical protein
MTAAAIAYLMSALLLASGALRLRANPSYSCPTCGTKRADGHSPEPLELSNVSRSRPSRRATFGIVAGLAAFTTTGVLALTRNGGAGSAPLPLSTLSRLGKLDPTPPAGPLGPEGVPIPHARPLAPPRLLANGQRIDGISCQSSEQVLFHIHAHLTIFVDGIPRKVPAGIGIAPPYEVEQTGSGQFIAGATCFMWLHTHSADGIIHTESPIRRTYRLGDFFDIWGQPLSRQRVGPARGHVTALLDGRAFTGNPRRIPLLPHAQIQLEVGNPLLAPEHIAFPTGL